MKKTMFSDILPGAEDNKKFNSIFDATVAVSGKDAVTKAYQDTGDRWRDIACAWAKLFDEEHKVFVEVIHKIHWGFYSNHMDDAVFKKLLVLVEEEIRGSGEAFRAWFTWDDFVEDLNSVLDELTPMGMLHNDMDCHFLVHHFYLRQRTRTDLIAGKGEICPVGYDARLYLDYEPCLRRLLPESAHWTKLQWINDLTVAEAFQRQYGVNYLTNADDYDRLMELLMIEWGTAPSKNYLWFAMAIQELPAKLAKVIWPNGTQAKIEELFVRCWRKVEEYHAAGCPLAKDEETCFHPVGAYAAHYLQNSWLYKYVAKWFYAGTCCAGLDAEIKQAIFALSTRF